MTVIAAIALALIIATCIAGIEAEQPTRAVSRKQSRAARDLRDLLVHMRRRR